MQEYYTDNITKIKAQRASLPPFKVDNRLNDPSFYIPTPALKNAVNVALMLGQPLILTGEPGTGKTQLANSVAWQLGLDKPYRFNTKSASKAMDLFYRYDSLRHFHAAQIKSSQEEATAKRFISLQALGKAIAEAHIKRSVVLVDEIDKAPRDFPNDLLREFEHYRFTIMETGENYPNSAHEAAAKANRPILIITSNSEKNLPNAFLRRCIFYHIPFPDKELLSKIVHNRINLSNEFKERSLQYAIEHFETIRGMGLRKKPATAELLAWIHVLQLNKIDLQNKNQTELEKIKMSYSVLAKNQDDLEKLYQLAMQ